MTLNLTTNLATVNPSNLSYDTIPSGFSLSVAQPPFGFVASFDGGFVADDNLFLSPKSSNSSYNFTLSLPAGPLGWSSNWFHPFCPAIQLVDGNVTEWIRWQNLTWDSFLLVTIFDPSTTSPSGSISPNHMAAMIAGFFVSVAV